MTVIEDARLKSLGGMPFAGKVFVTQSYPEGELEAEGRSTEKKSGALDGEVIAFSLAKEMDEKRKLWNLRKLIVMYGDDRFFILADKINKLMMNELYKDNAAVPGDLENDLRYVACWVSFIPSFYGGR